MKLILLIILLIPLSLFAIEKNDSITLTQNQLIQKIENSKNNIEFIKNELTQLNRKLEVQENFNEKTINGISTQLSAASYNLTIFGILFAIAAILLGIYITRIENKVVRIKEESISLLNLTIKNKEEVIAINNLIQKDIYGLFLKIKREETVHLLNRLLEVPEDVSNIVQQLLSRELDKEDYSIVKKAYIELKKLPERPRGLFNTVTSYKDLYRLIFFQHFIDKTIDDKEIGNEQLEFYEIGIESAFKNDILKSTSDFIKAIIELGFQNKAKEINLYIRGLSMSKYKNFESLYEIIFTTLKNKNDQFIFFELISDDKESRIGKANYGRELIKKYSNSELSVTQKAILEKTNALLTDLEKEEQERIVAEEKKIADEAERKRQQEQKIVKKEVKK